MAKTPSSLVRRKAISPLIRDEVLREAGYMCGNPTCHHILTLELHHMVWVKAGGSNDATNLIALCPNCHSLHTKGFISDSAIRHWKGILHALNHAFNKESMDLLLFLHKAADQAIWYSGDGLLKFAGLIAAGFAHIVSTQLAVGVRYGNSLPTSPPTSTHQIQLSEKGRALVDAWLKGDEDSYRKALQSSVSESDTSTE